MHAHVCAHYARRRKERKEKNKKIKKDKKTVDKGRTM